MGFGLGVVVDADKEDVGGVFADFGDVVAGADLRYGRLGGSVFLQLYNESRFADVFTGNQNNVGKTFAGRVFTVNYIVVSGIVVCEAYDAGEGILVVVGEYARILVVSSLDCGCHCLLVNGNGVAQQTLGAVKRTDYLGP